MSNKTDGSRYDRLNEKITSSLYPRDKDRDRNQADKDKDRDKEDKK